MKTILAMVSTLVILTSSKISFAAESELSATDPKVIKICTCVNQGLDANCQPLQTDRGQGDSQGGRH
jgi:hypothetical protein